MRTRPLILILAALALFLGACGDDEDGVTTVTETTTEVTTTTEAEKPQNKGNKGKDEAAPAADIEVDDSAAFATPSGNIECFMDKVMVRCDIAERDWDPPARPADCEGDYGQGITLSAGAAAELVCAGDTVLGSNGQELGYGQSISSGLLRCESEESGLACRDIETGRGFELSREGYEIF